MKRIRLSFVALLAATVLANAQYTQNFDGTTMPSDWTIINGGDAGQWEIWPFYSASTDIYPHSGDGFLGLEFGYSAHDDYAVSPPIQVVAGVSDKVSFWAYNGGASLAEKISVKVSTTTPTATAFTSSLVTDLKPPTSWTQYTYDLSAYVGQTIYISFYSDTTDVWYIAVDDFVISGGSLATNETEANLHTKIYPNPVFDYLFIDSKAKISDVKVIDFSGKVVLNLEDIESNKIYLGSLQSGNYILNFKENGIPKSKKIVKK